MGDHKMKKAFTNKHTNKNDLFNKLDHINQVFEVNFELNNEPIYGGWELTTKSGYTVKHRIPVKEMIAFLDGMINGNMFKSTVIHNYRITSK